MKGAERIMAKKSTKKQSKVSGDSSTSKNSALNQALYTSAQKILSLIDNNYETTAQLDAKGEKFQQIINRELDLANGISHGSIIDFIQSQRESVRKSKGNTDMMTQSVSSDIFTENIDQVYGYLTDLYNNKYNQINDLKYICKFVPVLGQALKTNLNQVCAADDIAEGIKRKIDFAISVDDDIRSSIENTIIEIEKSNNLLKKLKQTFKSTLTTGSSYVYRISYNELFELYAKKKRQGTKKGNQNAPFNMRNASEGYADTTSYCDAAIESITGIIKTVPDSMFNRQSKGKQEFINNTTDEVREIFDSFKISTNDILDEAYECAIAYEGISNNVTIMNGITYDRSMYGDPVMEANTKNESKKDDKPVVTHMPDGTKSPSDFNKDGSPSDSKFNISGSYLKYIEAGDMVPLEIFNQKVGYYHIVTKKKFKSSTKLGTGKFFMTATELSNQKKEKAMNAIVDSISNMIIENFDQKFLMDNQDFKKLIADCILAKGIADNEYSIQFIPAKYVYEFKINETLDGDGEALLSDSMMAGKMLMSYLVSKLLLFVNNSGDKTLVTIHRGQLDLNGKNQVDRTIRSLEGSTVSFGDFLSPSIMFNKFNRNTNITIPTSANGTRMLDFEKLEGKSIDMGTEMEEKLEKMGLIASSVPDSILEYVNDLQFSRQVVSSSIRYASDVSSQQSDLEEPMTRLYRDLCYDSNLSDEAKRYLPYLEISLPRPKVVANTNNNDSIRIGKENAEMIANMFYGEEPKTEDVTAKQQYILAACKETLPYIDWSRFEKLKEEIDTRFHGPKDESDSSVDTGGSDNF